jgi:NAD(P)-dependent dehydrogenase (short-subunit alcohol dehydrogenase family)
VADFRGKVALVTGVGRVGQIGHAVAAALGKAGAQLLLVDRVPDVAERAKEFTAQGAKARGFTGDLTNPDDARAAVALAQKEFGGLDVVINVAGGLLHVGPAAAIPVEMAERELAINVKTTFLMCQAAIPALAARGGGAIVNFASIAVLEPQAQMASYVMAKAAVAGLTRALALELAPQKIRVNAVAPAAARTADNVKSMGDLPELVPLDALVAAVLYLASDDARAVTGEVLPVTGRGI